MMSRRRFLQITVSMAAVAAAPNVIGKTRSELLPPPDEIWIPTVPEVAEWLEYYKLTVSGVHRSFTAIMAELGTVSDDEEKFIADFESAERDFDAMIDARRRVSLEQVSGYTAGQEGRERKNPRFRVPSHPGFGWYNYWAVGDYDRRRALGLPRLGRTLEEEYAIQREQEVRLIKGAEYLLE